MAKYIALNEDVLKELEKNYTFYVLWAIQGFFIDSEIHPVHNKDWVKNKKIEEAKALDRIKYTEKSFYRAWREKTYLCK